MPKSRLMVLPLLIVALILAFCPGCGRQPQAKGAQQPAGDAALALKAPLMGACSAWINGKIYVFGGMDSKGTDLATVLEIDPSSGTITNRADIPTPRNSAQAVIVGGKIMLVGGRDADGMVGSVEVYDPAKDSWEKTGDMDPPVWMHMAAVVGSKVYVMGGISSTGSARTSTNAVRVYDTSAKKWSKGPDLPAARQGAAVSVSGKRIYLFGGRLGGASTSGQATDTVIVLDTSTGKWTNAKKMPAARTSGQPVTVGGKVYIVGGAAGGQVTKSVDVYDLASDAWSSGPSLKTARSGHCAASAGNKLYVIGGASGTSVDTMLRPIEIVEVQ